MVMRSAWSALQLVCAQAISAGPLVRFFLLRLITFRIQDIAPKVNKLKSNLAVAKSQSRLHAGGAGFNSCGASAAQRHKPMSLVGNLLHM